MKHIGAILILLGVGVNYAYSQDSIVAVPDTAFLHALIDEGVDTNGDSLISYEEAYQTTTLWLGIFPEDDDRYKLINDLTGIEAFINLDTLNCDYLHIKALDVSNNLKLRYLSCCYDSYYGGRGSMTEIDLSNNPFLSDLHLYCTLIDSLDLSNNPELTTLFCGDSRLSSLDLTNNPRLKKLRCMGNLLASLDLSNNRELLELECWRNQLSTLDVSNNPWLQGLLCSFNRLTGLDVSNCTKLRTLLCENNLLTSLDVSNCYELESLWCDGNQLTSLDLSNCIALKKFICRNNPIGMVCVWETFPDGVNVVTEGSPDVYFTTECSDYTAPEITAIDTLFQPDYISVTSSEDGIIYVVAENTEKDVTAIRESCIDSVIAVSNTPVNISLSEFDNGTYWLFARDSTCNISEPEAFTIRGVGIEKSKAEEINLYPNPANTLLNINTRESIEYFIEITSLNGQLILSKEIEGNTHQLDLSSFQKGVYFITIRSHDFVTTKKIIKL